MKCPYCSQENTRVIDSRPADDNSSIRRRRLCDACGKRFTTYEKIETIPVIVIKKDNNREPYDRSKIEAGVLRACHKRPVSANEITGLIDEVETDIFSREEKEIPSSVIGELVMNKLKDLSFVSKMDLELTDKNTVTVTVYEKSIAGCVLYKGDYVYFDKDGIVLDSSKRRVGSAPLIKGLTFTEWSIGKKLPSDDDKKFQTILTITQLVEKYDLEIDGIKFTAENEIVLQHGGITIELGEGEYLAVQMMNLGNILKNLEGMSGTLYMKDFDSENATASFSKN